MRLRLASIAFLLGSAATGVSWLTLHPALVQLIDAVHKYAPHSPAVELLTQIRGLLPFYLALDLIAVTGLVYLVLHLAVARPLGRTEKTIHAISQLELDRPVHASGGPLLSRLNRSLKRMADALLAEQALTRSQLTRLEAANETLSRAQTELIASERMATVGRLAAGVAHEVGNPLAGILGYASLARARAREEPELVEMLERIEAEVQRIDQIVRGLLDLGRPARGEARALEVSTIVDGCVKLLGAGPDFSGVKIDLKMEEGLIAMAESGPLSQILLNLLLNASQALQGSGEIRLFGRRSDGRVEIEVRDFGPGIAPEALTHLFEPFFTTRPAGKGSGLGLAISRHLANSMGGELTAENSDGGGARFVLTLPAPASLGARGEAS
jgi:two-component system, NtrC family, sensor kinase